MFGASENYWYQFLSKSKRVTQLKNLSILDLASWVTKAGSAHG